MEYLNRQRINPKLRQWTLGADAEMGFAICDRIVSDFYVYLSIAFSTSYHWWIYLFVSLLSFVISIFILIIFFLLFTFNYFILFYFVFFLIFFFSFFFFFSPIHFKSVHFFLT